MTERRHGSLWIELISPWRAVLHEIRCGECRVSWSDWWGRLPGTAYLIGGIVGFVVGVLLGKPGL